MNAPTKQSEHSHPWYHRPGPMAALTLALIVAFFLLREHWNHVTGLWPYLLLLACPLMHLFHGHGGHGGQGSHAHRQPSTRDEAPK